MIGFVSARGLHRTTARPLWLMAALAIPLGAHTSACAGHKRVVVGNPATSPLPVRTDTDVGACADPTSEGVFGKNPTIERADRDLDGDGNAEMVVVDRALCTTEENCHWNIYRTEGECHRYVGTVSAFTIQRMSIRGEDGFYALRGVWNLTGGKRVLMQEYRFQRGGYRLHSALLCRHDEDRLLCEVHGR